MTTLASEATLDRIVARFNVDRYRKKLAEESDKTKRQILLDLIAEETAKMCELTPAKIPGSAASQ